jgi:hypothetical protein
MSQTDEAGTWQRLLGQSAFVVHACPAFGPATHSGPEM